VLVALSLPFILPGVGLYAATVLGRASAGERLACLLGGTVFLIIGCFIVSRAAPEAVRHLRGSDVPAVRSLSRRAPSIALRLVIGIMCFTPMLIATGVIPTEGKPPAPRWIGLLAALVFTLGGLYVLLFDRIRRLEQPARRRVEGLTVLLIVSCFAVIADWIAVGPGQRAFTSTFSGGPFGVSWLADELVGRVVFGLSGAFLSAISLVGWWQFLRRGEPT